MFADGYALCRRVHGDVAPCPTSNQTRRQGIGAGNVAPLAAPGARVRPATRARWRIGAAAVATREPAHTRSVTSADPPQALSNEGNPAAVERCGRRRTARPSRDLHRDAERACRTEVGGRGRPVVERPGDCHGRPNKGEACGERAVVLPGLGAASWTSKGANSWPSPAHASRR